MDVNTYRLNDLVKRFLGGEIDGVIFEKKFADLFDFEEFSDDQIKTNCFQEIRELLEHFTSNACDLKKFPQQYIDEKELKQKVLKQYKMAGK